MTLVTAEMFWAFHGRTIEHREEVNYFSRMLGYEFESHDSSKWAKENIKGFILANAHNNLGLTLDEEDIETRDRAIFNHVKTEPHHPEYWDDKLTWETYTVNPKSFNNDIDSETDCRVDARKMNKESMIEMGSDICAVSKELGGDPRAWLKENMHTRWRFDKNQEQFLSQTVGHLWETHLKNIEHSRVENDGSDIEIKPKERDY